MAVHKAFVLLAIFGVLASGAHGRMLLQEEESMEEMENMETIQWFVPSDDDLGMVTVPVGSAVTFSWTALHDLWEVPSMECPEEFTNGTDITELAAQTTGGSHVVNFTEAGIRYFACSVSDHCEEGQLIAISAGGSPAPAPGPSSRYGRGYGGGSNCGGSSTSGSGYGGSSGSGSNYAGPPGTSAYGGSAGTNATSSYGGGNASYSGGGAGYGGGGSSSYGGGSDDSDD